MIVQSLKFKIYNPYFHSTLALPSLTSRTKHSAGQYYKDLQSITYQIEIFFSTELLEAATCNNLFSHSHPEKKEFSLSVEKLFQLLRKYLWCHHHEGIYHYVPSGDTDIDGKHENNNGILMTIQQDSQLLQDSLTWNQLWFPKLVQMESIKYDQRDHILFPVSSNNAKSESQINKKYPVICENHSLVLSFMNELQKWMNQVSEVFPYLTPFIFFPSHMITIRSMQDSKELIVSGSSLL